MFRSFPRTRESRAISLRALGPRFPPSLKLRRTTAESVEASAKTGRGDERVGLIERERNMR